MRSRHPVMQTLIQSSNRIHTVWNHLQQPTLGLRAGSRMHPPRLHPTAVPGHTHRTPCHAPMPLHLCSCYPLFPPTPTPLPLLPPTPQVWVKPSAELQFLYGNHVLKSGLGRITEATPGYTGVVVYSMSGEQAAAGECGCAAVECGSAVWLCVCRLPWRRVQAAGGGSVQHVWDERWWRRLLRGVLPGRAAWALFWADGGGGRGGCGCASRLLLA
jgi:hypothetical protein